MTQTTAIIVTVDHPQFAAVAALLSGTAAPAAPKSEPTAAPSAEASTGTATTRKKASAKPASEASADTTETKNSADTTKAGSTDTDEEANKAAYLEVKKRILALSEKDRDAVVSVLKTFGVAKGSDLTPDQYPDVVAALDEALEDEEEDLS